MVSATLYSCLGLYCSLPQDGSSHLQLFMPLAQEHLAIMSLQALCIYSLFLRTCLAAYMYLVSSLPSPIYTATTLFLLPHLWMQVWGASSFIQTDSSTSTTLLGYSYKRVELDRKVGSS